MITLQVLHWLADLVAWLIGLLPLLPGVLLDAISNGIALLPGLLAPIGFIGYFAPLGAVAGAVGVLTTFWLFSVLFQIMSKAIEMLFGRKLSQFDGIQ